MGIKENIASNVRNRRLALKMTQVELANQSGKTIRYISQLENSALNPTVTTMAEIAEVLKVEVIDLLQPVVGRKKKPLAIKSIADEDREGVVALNLAIKELVALKKQFQNGNN